MKSHCVSRLFLIPSVLKLSILFVAFSGVSDVGLCKIEPTGRKIKAVQFDVIMELNSSPQLTPTLLFARYWVASEYYSIGVMWAEPQGGVFNFCVYPPTLSITSNKDCVSMAHEIYPIYNKTYSRPLGGRGVFRFMYGDYPIPNMRFADEEAVATRIYDTDLRSFEDPNRSPGVVMDVQVSPSQRMPKREVAQLKVQANGPRIDSMQLFNAEQHLLKSITYEYDKEANTPGLLKQKVVLPEQPHMVGFQGKGMTVKVDGTNYQFRDVKTTHHDGGRICSVKYKPIRLGDTTSRFPVSIEVRDGQDKHILRSARLMNYKLISLNAEGAWKAANQFAGATAQERHYRELLSKYWGKNPTAVEGNDVEATRELLAHFNKQVASPGINYFEQLKDMNILMELNRIIGDNNALEECYCRYLCILGDNGLSEMSLVGGYQAIETIMLWGRYNEASRLVQKWVETTLGINKPVPVLCFAEKELDRKHFWTTVKLLEGVLDRERLSAGLRFESLALKCLALNGLDKLLRDADVAQNTTLRSQVDWVLSSTSLYDLQRMLKSCLDETARIFSELLTPTESQKALKAQIDTLQERLQKVAQKDSNSVRATPAVRGPP